MTTPAVSVRRPTREVDDVPPALYNHVRSLFTAVLVEKVRKLVETIYKGATGKIFAKVSTPVPDPRAVHVR